MSFHQIACVLTRGTRLGRNENNMRVYDKLRDTTIFYNGTISIMFQLFKRRDFKMIVKKFLLSQRTNFPCFVKKKRIT